MNRNNFSLYTYSSSVLRFYNVRMTVRIKMCRVNTVGMEWGVGNELTGS